MRADRLLSVLLLLRRRGRLTAAELAAELEVSVRTVLRDMEALSTAGVPVYAERGRHGGFALLGGYSTDLTGLTHAEAMALFTASSRAASTSLGMAPSLASAMRKLTAAMPEPQRDSAEHAGQRILLQPTGWLAEPEVPRLLRIIEQAVFTDRRIKIRYPSRGGSARWRTIDPVGLVHADGHWYLLATDHGADRTYRVSRAIDAEILDAPSARPVDVDLAEAWQQRRQAFFAAQPRYPVRVRARAPLRDHLARAALECTAETTDTDQWLLLDLTFADQRHAASVLWSLGPDAEVIDPRQLRDAFTARAEDMLRHYRRSSDRKPNDQWDMPRSVRGSALGAPGLSRVTRPDVVTGTRALYRAAAFDETASRLPGCLGRNQTGN